MTSNKVNLTAQERKIFGRKVKNLRKSGIIPGNIFGKKIKSQSIQVSSLDFEKAFRVAGETGLISLKVDQEKEKPVLVSMVQTHPITGEVIHVDLHQVDLKEKVRATVPLHFTGESPAVKEKGAILLHVLSELEIEALPTDIPNHIDVSIESLREIGDSIKVRDLSIDKTKVIIEESVLEEAVAIVQLPKAEEVEAKPSQEEASENTEAGEAPETKTEE